MIVAIIKGNMALLGGTNAIYIVRDTDITRDEVVEVLCNSKKDMFPNAIDIGHAKWKNLKVENGTTFNFRDFKDEGYIELKPTNEEFNRYINSKSK